MRALFAAFSCVAFVWSGAWAEPTLEDYAAHPDFSAASISPDGETIAIVHRIEGQDYLCLLDIDTRTETCPANIGELEVTRTFFLDDEYVIAQANGPMGNSRRMRRYTRSAAYSVNLNSGDVRALPEHARRMHGRQSGVGTIIAYDAERQIAYMPAYNNSSRPELDVWAAPLAGGSAEQVYRGSRYTMDWFMSPQGEVLARENFDWRRELYSIEVPDGDDDWRVIYSEETDDPNIYARGVTGDRTHLVMTRRPDDVSENAIYHLSLDTGEITGPFLQSDEGELGGVALDINRVSFGALYEGMTPRYRFDNPDADRVAQTITQMFPTVSADFVGMSSDARRFLYRISGGQYSGNYIVYDAEQEVIVLSIPQRRAIRPEFTAPSETIEYQARDGLTIPALLTWPPGINVSEAADLPMIVMPHGGPESHDSVGYYWLSQVLASRGYLIFQPNFRGSSGFGRAHTLAGRGEWGRAMQNDVTDGVTLLTGQGWADPERVCIVGWSYGGYSALAGGAFTPDLYQCVVAIAGVADLHYMLDNVEDRSGDESSAYEYWVDQYGQNGVRRQDLEPISPYYHAEAFTAPVLLLHGESDGVVSYRQSTRMEDALEDAGKDVTLRLFDGQNHSILDEEARLEVLESLVSFVDEHIGAPR